MSQEELASPANFIYVYMENIEQKKGKIVKERNDKLRGER